MKNWALLIVGALVGLLGAVWTLQGANAISGSSMSGTKTWLVVGVVLIVVALVMIAMAARQLTAVRRR
ncbi:MAG: hypothetical protein M3Z00_09595 [Actinomycetota bacterium]|nr:hypothetical protein [Actinomycetota bacterium]